MKLLGVGLLLAAFIVAPALAQKPDAPAPKKPAATTAKPKTKPAVKPADTPQAKPTTKPAARPTARRVAPPWVPPPVPYEVKGYQGDVPSDPARHPWQPPPRGQR